MEAIDLLNRVLQDEELCHMVAQDTKLPGNQCAKRRVFHNPRGTMIFGGKVPKWHMPRLFEWVANSVLLEAQTGTQIPVTLERGLNAAVTAGDLNAGYETTRAIRDYLVTAP